MEEKVYEVQRTNLVFEEKEVEQAMQCLRALAHSEVPGKEDDLRGSLELAAAVLEGFLANEGFNTTMPRPKRPFAISETQRRRIPRTESPVGVITMANRIQSVLPYDMERVSQYRISNWLTERNILMFDRETVGNRRRIPTDAGKELGITTMTVKQADGTTFEKTVFGPAGQNFVIDNLESIMTRREKAGAGNAGL